MLSAYSHKQVNTLKGTKMATKPKNTTRNSKIKKLPRNGWLSRRKLVPVAAIVLVASVGTYLVMGSYAATYPALSGFGGYNCKSEPVLKYGSTGECVKVVQAALNNWINLNKYLSSSFPIRQTLVVDGKFGSLTKAAVQEFQRRHGLTADGIVGSKTWAALGSDCAVWNTCFQTGGK